MSKRRREIREQKVKKPKQRINEEVKAEEACNEEKRKRKGGNRKRGQVRESKDV